MSQLALTVSNAVAGEVGPAIDAVAGSTLFIFFVCVVGGYLLLERTHPFSETILMFSSTLVATGAGGLIVAMRIDLDPVFPFWLGVVIFGIGLLTLFFSRWRTGQKARVSTGEKTA